MGTNNRQLKAFVRFSATGRIVAGSLVLRKQMPKNGKWLEVQSSLCCEPTTTSTTTTTTTTEIVG